MIDDTILCSLFSKSNKEHIRIDETYTKNQKSNDAHRLNKPCTWINIHMLILYLQRMSHYKKNCIYLQQKFVCNIKNPYVIQNYLRVPDKNNINR